MLYETIYNNIISKRILCVPNSYTETHHIVPKSFGGSNDQSNLVKLTAREHYLAHYLLLKMQRKGTKKYISALKAFFMMQCNSSGNRYVSSRKFEHLRQEFSKIQSMLCKGFKNSSFGTIWICNPNLGVNIKLKKGSVVPDGFVLGKNKVQKVCPICKQIFICRRNVNICSKECGSKYKKLHAHYKLNWNIANDIRTNVKYKVMTPSQIADIFGVSRVNILNILTNKIYSMSKEYMDCVNSIEKENLQAKNVYSKKKKKISIPRKRGVNSKSSKINIESLNEIREAQKNYYRGQDIVLAKKYNVGKDVIGRIRRMERYN